MNSPSSDLVRNGQDLDDELEPAALPAIDFDIDTAKVKQMTNYCREAGKWPENWTKMKAPEKRLAFKQLFAPDEVATDTFDPNDPIHLMSHEVENIEEADLKERLAALALDVGNNYFLIGGLLSIVTSKSLFTQWGFEKFKDWVHAETDFELRKAQHLIRNYNRVVDLDIPFSAFQNIGWTKISMLLKVLSQENVRQWVEKAKALDIDSLAKEIKEARAKETSDDSSVTEGGAKTKQKLFKFHDDQYDTVQNALDLMKEQLPTEHENVAVEHICALYVTGQLGGDEAVTPQPTSKDAIVAMIADLFQALKDLDGETDTTIWEEVLPPIEEIFPDTLIEVTPTD
jgi:hypothetical protein